jgi:hypothetical protein
MAFSQKQHAQATEHQHITALTEQIHQKLTEGVTVDSIHKVYHSDQYMTAGMIYFSNGDQFLVFGEDGNAENFEGSIRNAYHFPGSNYDQSEIEWYHVKKSSDRTNKVKEVKNYFDCQSRDFKGSIIWVS